MIHWNTAEQCSKYGFIGADSRPAFCLLVLDEIEIVLIEYTQVTPAKISSSIRMCIIRVCITRMSVERTAFT